MAAVPPKVTVLPATKLLDVPELRVTFSLGVAPPVYVIPLGLALGL